MPCSKIEFFGVLMYVPLFIQPLNCSQVFFQPLLWAFISLRTGIIMFNMETWVHLNIALAAFPTPIALPGIMLGHNISIFTSTLAMELVVGKGTFLVTRWLLLLGLQRTMVIQMMSPGGSAYHLIFPVSVIRYNNCGVFRYTCVAGVN